MSVELVELDKHVRDLKNTVLEKDFKIFELEECVRNKDLEIEKCLERLNDYEKKLHKMGQTNQTVHMIMPSKDNLYNGRKRTGFENLSYFEKAKDLTPSLYDEKVIGLGYTLMFLIHSDEALEIEKFKRSRENKIEFAYDYENLNASYVNEKINFEDDYFQEIINPDFEKINSPFQQTSSLKPYVSNVILEKIIIDLKGKVVITSGMYKLSVSQSVSQISMSKTSCNSNNVENLDTFSSVRRPKHSNVVWKKKRSSNTSNVDLSAVSHSNLNKNVKRYSRKDLLACNNSHLGETSSAYVCNDAMNVSCNSKMCDLLDDSNFFIFDDESVKISPVSKMLFRKKTRDSMNHMTGNRALLTNFVEKFLGTVRFGNNDFAVITGYGYVVIGSMTIKKVYYVEGLGHNLFSVGQFYDKGLEVAFRTTCFVRNEDGVDLLTGDRSSNLYTIALNEVASNSSTCLLAKASSSIYNKRTRKIHESVNANLDEISEMASKQFTLEPGLSNLNEREKSLNPSVSKVSEASKKDLEDLFQDFYDEYFDSSKIIKSSTTNVETSINKEVFHEVSESFQRESSSSSLNDNVQQSPEAVILPQTNTQSISNNMIPNGDEASTSYNVFNGRLKDAYFDASTSFHDPSNVHTYYQHYPHEKNSIEPANVAEALRDADWVSAMQEELDQFARLNDVGKLKVKGDIGVFVGYSKESAAFRIYNKRTRKIHKSVNANFDEISLLDYKQFSLEPDLSNLNEREKSLNPSVSKVSEASKKDLEDLFQNFYDEYFDSSKIMKSSTMNVETSINKEIFHEVSESFQRESSSSSLNDNVQ
nr:integrase, catalytic region, zinc finger, CCHC-type, peptidase aspartic, catalytic [Tanacetum cinerariifolium]